uniref:Metalloendopeptidase n=1 Tax=Strongyloides venezuelensis TaxID=75913 RepID=A0A0K0EUD0_STRVS
MDILKFISILLFLIVKLKKIICVDMCKENHIINKRDILSDEFSSWIMPINYQIKDSSLNKDVIKKAIEEIENNTCIRFEEKDLSANNTQGIVFEYSKTNCASKVGRVFKNNTQSIQLTKDCSNKKGVILHELGHALGLLHEHCRTDRDDYITVKEENIVNGEKVNFEIQNHSAYTNFSIHYDYSSIMHYGQYDFANWNIFNPWLSVLESKLNIIYNKMMGQRLKMTFNDYKKLNFAYCKCNEAEKKRRGKGNKKRKNNEEKKTIEPKNKIQCLNGGYIASSNCSNCSKCICPFGYTGDLCNEIMTSDIKCNKTTFNASEILYTYWIAGPEKCFFFLVAQQGKKIELSIYYSSAPYRSICTDDVSHQIKYLKDKGTTGLLLCSWQRNVINLKSESNSVLLYFNGNSNNALIQFGFKQVD